MFLRGCLWWSIVLDAINDLHGQIMVKPKSPWSYRHGVNSQGHKCIIPTLEGKDVPDCYGVTVIDDVGDVSRMEVKVHLGDMNT